MKERTSRLSPLLCFIGVCAIVFASLSFKSNAQNCVNPNVNPATSAFAQGHSINVRINSSQFTPAEINCLTAAFSNWNTANNNNFSGVQFNITSSGTAVITTDANGAVVSATADDVYQVNRSTVAVTGVATTGGQTDGSVRINAFTNIHPNVTNCTALAQTMAHEIGHVMGLGECTGCNGPQQSVMAGIPCLQTNASGNCISIDYNNTTWGLGGPTGCDNNVVHQNQQYRCTNHNPSNCEGLGFTWDEQSCTCNTCYCNSPEHSGWCSEEEIRCTSDGRIFDWCLGYCTFYSPILVDVTGDGFDLTDAANGVFFDISGDSHLEKISWVSATSDDAWLVLDRNADGQINNGKELFGNFTPQPDPLAFEEKNGFRALAEYDKPSNGGNADGIISDLDSVFPALNLWHDVNHNGVSEPSELKTLIHDGIDEIDLDYKESKRTDSFGNRFRYRAKIKDAQGTRLGRWAWDVYLQPVP